MENQKIKIRLIVTHAKCSKCGYERTLYFSTDNMYGERIVSTKSGKFCAYVNLLDESLAKELEKYCIELFFENSVSFSKSKIARIVSNIYGITCDEIFDEKIDTIPNIKCVNCCNTTMVEKKEYGECLVDVEAFKVSHKCWNNLDKNGKKEAIRKELIRQGYIMD